MDNKRIILYDGICNLCNWTVKFIRKRDVEYQFTMIPLQSVTGKLYAKKYKLEIENPHSVILIEGGEVYDESEAGVKIMGLLKGTKTISKILKLLPENLRDFTYKQIARHRYKIFGKNDHCDL